MDRERLLHLAPFALFAVAAVAMQHYFIDDSFISFRYARNLVEGHGLVFNAGERVEGYTNFLWVLGVAAGLALGASAEPASLFLGIASGLVCLYATARLAAVMTSSRWALLAPVLLGTSTPFVFWTFSGMETVAVAALVTLGLWGLLAEGTGHRSLVLGALALSLACLTRPDAVLVLGVAVVALPWLRPRSPIAAVLTVAGVAAAVLVPYAVWKWSYYGALLPNTFHAKVGGTFAQVLRGLRHTGTFVIFASASGLLPGALLALRTPDPRRLTIAAIAAIHTLYVILVGDDSFPFYRFQVPMLPLLAVLAALGFESLHRALFTFGPPRHRWVVPALAAIFVLAGAGWGHQGHYRTAIADKAQINRKFQQIGLWLKRRSDPQDRVALIAAGIIPYYSELPTLDMLGLTDAHIGRRKIESIGAGMAGHEKGDGRYVLRQEPRYILIHPITTPQPATLEQLARSSRRYVSTRELWALPEFHRSYALRSVPMGPFYFNFFEHRSFELPR